MLTNEQHALVMELIELNKAMAALEIAALQGADIQDVAFEILNEEIRNTWESLNVV